MLQLGILIMIYYCVHFTASTDPELSVVQYPEDASVLLNSTVWMLCVFEYPEEENEMPVVYWRKGPDYNNLQSLQSSTGAARPHVRIIKNVLKGFSILKLSNVDHSASNSYFCDVTLTQNVQSKRGSGTNLTVHGKEHLGVTEMDLILKMQRLYKIRQDLVGLVSSSWIHHLCHHSYHSFHYSSGL
ncbi:uncharacterized protein LOC112989573 isoform X2 [Dromaius novaehollandiae]|uniref:uncharacterized protein LOC112989573 isoform X2 n=1 Tax=Dromaius novaehollandiae TaxID=8790 RepID=UPI000E1E2FEE|nr:uncharacterized protein LOC112989573 isoform X2 [Dromaius novaehollandiae]